MSCPRECSVCYGESGPFVKLCCSHEFCSGCIKSWYLKGTGTGCPMCRRPMYFRGFHKMQKQWDEDSWELRCADVLGEAIDERFTEFMECLEEDCEAIANENTTVDAAWLALDLLEMEVEPKVLFKFMNEIDSFRSRRQVISTYRSYVMKELKTEMIRLERTYNFLKSEEVSSETIEEVLIYSNDYYSDRSINRWTWYNEPRKEFATKYPELGGGVRTGKRGRALEDVWAEMSFYIIV